MINSKKNNNKLFHKAFTLAEVLLVMSIIGVVAALTIPNLANSTNEQETATRVRGIVNELNQAYKIAINKYDDAWATNSYGNRILDSMQFINSCTKSNTANCFATNPKIWQSSNFLVGNGTSAVFKDGSSIFFKDDLNFAVANAVLGPQNVTLTGVDSPTCLVYIDVDGPQKGYNTLGIDIFQVFLGENGVILGQPDLTKVNSANSSYWNLTYWLVQNGNMEYLRCINKLKNGVTTCN